MWFRNPAIFLVLLALCNALSGCRIGGGAQNASLSKSQSAVAAITAKVISNEPPVLDAIADETINENAAMSTVNAGMNALDVTGSGLALTYTCSYNVGTNCTSLPGAMTFTAATGVLTWTPDYTASGVYTFIITGSDGALSDTEDFIVTVNNVNRAPVVDAIGDETINENAAMTTVNAADGADDFDADAQAVTYTCTYNAGTACTSLPGTKSFTAGTGALTWTPDYTAAGTYNFTITGSDGTLSDGEDFTITVSNVNQAPVASNITPTNGHTNIQSVFTLSYTDPETDLATSCAISALSNVTVTQACACDGAGVCTVGVTSTLNTYGAAGFSYTVTALGGTSNTATSSYTIKNPFISVWRTTGAAETITVPLQVGFTYNAKVSWGDGTALSDITSSVDADRVHTYATAGDYTVTISGVFQSIYFNNGGDKLKIRQVPDLGDVGWTSFANSFYGCTNLSTFAGGDTSAVTTMAYMFFGATLANPDTTNWNTANVTNMTYMFCNATSANPVTSTSGNIWNTGNVTNMAYMFGGATIANPNTTNWNTANVTNMSNMFYNAPSANPNTTNWNTANVTTMQSMFQGATSANPVTSTSGNIWNTANVTNMGNMFYGATLANPNTTNWNTANVTNMSYMFCNATSANPVTSTSGNIWNTGNVTNMAYMFGGATIANPNTANWNTANVTNMGNMFYNAPSANPVTATSGNIWNTGLVTNMGGMFYGATTANPNTANWNTANVTNMAWMFAGATLANPNTTNWNTAKVTAMNHMFYAATNANPVTATSGSIWNTGLVTNMSSMFYLATNANPDTTNWDTSKVTNMAQMFENAPNANPNTANWDTSLVTAMNNMFCNATSANPNTANWNTANVTNMGGMFQGAISANPVTATSGNFWNTTNVTSMAQMFYGTTLANPDMSGWNFANVTTMSNMFNLAAAFTNANYSTMLTRITATSVKTGVPLHGGTAKYTAGAATTARANLVAASWTITDGGAAP